jgi:hypothetical protein
MKSILLILLSIAGSGALYGQPPRLDKGVEWKLFESDKFKFRILFPGEPAVKSTDLQAKAGIKTAHWFSVEAGGIKYEVSCSEYQSLPKMDRDALKKNYDSNRDGVLKATGFSLIQESEIELGKHFGKEVVLKAGNEIVIDRMYTVDQRMYQLVVTIWAKDFEENKKPALVTRFLDSFQIKE